MKDWVKVNLLYTLAVLPLVLVACVIFFSSYIVYSSPVPLWLIWTAIFSFAFAVIVVSFHPRCKHWRKAYYEFEENYRYEEAAE